MLAPWLDRRGTGAPSPRGPTPPTWTWSGWAPPQTPTRSRTPRSPSRWWWPPRCWRTRLARRVDRCRRGPGRRRALGRRAGRRRGGRRAHPGCGGRAGRGAGPGDGRRVRAGADGHVRGAGREPRRGARPPRRARPGRRQPQRRRPDRRRRLRRRPRRLAANPPARARVVPLAGRRRVPHPVHGARARRRSARHAASVTPADPTAHAAVQRRRRGRRPTAPRRCAGSSPRSPGPCAGTPAWRRCATLASPR